jgi:hypothetical protein
MQFLIQHNLLSIEQLELTRKAVEPYPHQFIGLIPFSREITSDIPIEGTDYIPYGSTLLTFVGSQENKWKGLFFDLEKFNYSAALANRDDMLNSNVMSLKEAIDQLAQMESTKLVFTRPSEDLKQFTGQVIEAGECHDWFKSMMECESSGSYKLDADTQVVLCDPQNIQAEFRWFVVGGKVVSGSMYRHNNQLRSLRMTEQAEFEEAQKFADKWLPSPCCVMDLALVNGELKVVEMNCINASGFYDNDVNAIFKSLYEYCLTLERQ